MSPNLNAHLMELVVFVVQVQGHTVIVLILDSQGRKSVMAADTMISILPWSPTVV